MGVGPMPSTVSVHFERPDSMCKKLSLMRFVLEYESMIRLLHTDGAVVALADMRSVETPVGVVIGVVVVVGLCGAAMGGSVVCASPVCFSRGTLE